MVRRNPSELDGIGMVNSIHRISLDCLVTEGMELKSMNSLIDGFHHSFQMQKCPSATTTIATSGHRHCHQPSPPPPPVTATTTSDHHRLRPPTTTVVQHKRVFWSFVIIPFQFFYKPNKQIPIHLTDYISLLSTKHLVKTDNILFQFLPDFIPLTYSISSEIILRTKRPLRVEVISVRRAVNS